jgi:heparosan-N-sulfate-glucuronate 5-epimerase
MSSVSRERGVGGARRLTPRKALSGVAADLGAFVWGASIDYGSDLNADPLAYPLALERLLDADPLLFSPFDAEGVPLQMNEQHGALYMPSRIAGYGLAQWNLARLGDEQGMDRFLTSANWFLRQPCARFMQHIRLEGMTPPWPSCLAQGEGVSVLVRAYRATGDRRYLTQARAALRLLEVSVGEGGVASTLADGGFFVEEYPGGRHRHVLNGALFAIVGLHDLVRLSGEGEDAAVALRDGLLHTLERNLGLWSVGGWSIYSLDRSGLGLPNACTVHYHQVHIALLEHLAPLAPGVEPVLAVWRGALTHAARRFAALALKSAYRATTGW